MIVSFGDKATADLFHNRRTRRVRRYTPEILRSALQQLDMINSSRDVRDLRSPPGNRLERLKGDLKGYYSVRINNQWRLIFRWEAADAHEVRIVDYHRG
ncbi:MAG: type II toxin-antitoxin system RelE/ParE family toxin [bacterium]|nr:type II toxin-antitoxin system RelE/ParE family toxin [bacterium]